MSQVNFGLRLHFPIALPMALLSLCLLSFRLPQLHSLSKKKIFEQEICQKTEPRRETKQIVCEICVCSHNWESCRLTIMGRKVCVSGKNSSANVEFYFDDIGIRQTAKTSDEETKSSHTQNQFLARIRQRRRCRLDIYYKRYFDMSHNEWFDYFSRLISHGVAVNIAI